MKSSLKLFSGLFILLLAVVYIIVQKAMKPFDIDFSTTKGKVIIITGANSGLGYYTALELAKHDADVILACRSSLRCEEAKHNILKEYPSGKVSAMSLDLSSFQSIRKFAEMFSDKYDHLDVLVNNAGIMAIAQRELSPDGLEMQVGTNHFGHFLLTALLYPKLSQNGRIINHSSGTHVFAESTFPFKNLNGENYEPWTVYGNSKLANLLFTYSLNRKLQESGNPKNITSIAVHPGYTSTNLQKDRFPLWQVANCFAMSGPDGALSQIYAAVDPRAKASDKNFVGPEFLIMGKPRVQTTRSNSWNIAAQDKLWEESVRITGLDIAFPKENKSFTQKESTLSSSTNEL